ncbi:ROK family protein [Enterococcus sp. RIT-PI-f]|uniref:ROK family protein n=1 Tax=Enterococcus sp. RIT-PI-f TaxID=1690244 RepID=UPI0006B91E4A|nr:ROK family protein [Enterococcus sp. RIT-PI-f]KPG69558.1 sugar kinase [Enterococcus sp. RIT-PI-f]
MYLGIDIGGTTIKYGFINDKGQVYNKKSIKTVDDKQQFLDNLQRIIEDSQRQETIEGIGISAPGIIDQDGTMITAGAIKSIYGVRLKQELQKITTLPIVIENDANAAAIAEQWIGHAQGVSNYLCIVLGTGIGGGIICQNELIRGAHGMAGEFGWMVIKDIDDSSDIEAMSLNQRAAVIGGLCYRYNQIKLKSDSTFEPIWDAKEIFAKENDDNDAHILIQNFYEDLSIGILNLISCFDPELVLIGGGISANKVFLERLQSTISKVATRHHSIHYLMDKTIAPIKAAKLMNDAGMVGAVYQIKKMIHIGAAKI